MKKNTKSNRIIKIILTTNNLKLNLGPFLIILTPSGIKATQRPPVAIIEKVVVPLSTPRGRVDIRAKAIE